jgi:hypothetical protein
MDRLLFRQLWERPLRVVVAVVSSVLAPKPLVIPQQLPPSSQLLSRQQLALAGF